MSFRFLGAQWLAIAYIGLVSFGLSILVARTLGSDLFGVYAVAAYVSLFESDTSATVVVICSGQAIALREAVQKMNVIARYEIEVRINPAFVCANEISRLCGSNSYLKKLIGFSPKFTFDQTLRSMFEAKT